MKNRREFVKDISILGSAMFAASNASSMNLKTERRNDFDLKIYATNWGFQGSSEDFCRKAKDEGYDGIEVWVPNEKAARDALMESISKHGLSYGFLAGNWGASYEEHWDRFQMQVTRAASLKPAFINCHSGKDFFTPKQATAFLKYTTGISKESGIPIYHETHRGRILFAPHITKHFLEDIEDLRLTLDISHWCCVAESLLADQVEAVELALSRTEHVHSRIGFQEGPQVPEPRAPEWQQAVDAHYAWWDRIIERKKLNGELLTMTTEFGPPGYMWTLPYTKQPLANLWDVNVHMMHAWRERYLS